MLRSEDIDDFNIDSLYQISTLDIYYNILNIIGVRLNKFPDAGLTIIGCNSDLSIEKGNTRIIAKRAEFIKQYLVNVWNISDKRIAVKAQNLSDKASTPYTEPDKIRKTAGLKFTRMITGYWSLYLLRIFSAHQILR